MNQQITLPYGHQTKTIEIPEKNLACTDCPLKAGGPDAVLLRTVKNL